MIRKFKTFEYADLNSPKLTECENNYGKYAIIETTNELGLLMVCKILKTFGYFVTLEYYEWDDNYDAYEVTPKNVHLSHFNILKIFDNFKDAMKECEDMIDAKKYNL